MQDSNSYYSKLDKYYYLVQVQLPNSDTFFNDVFVFLYFYTNSWCTGDFVLFFISFVFAFFQFVHVLYVIFCTLII